VIVTSADVPVGRPPNLIVSAPNVRDSCALTFCARARIPMATIMTVAVDTRQQARRTDRVRILNQCATVCVIAVSPRCDGMSLVRIGSVARLLGAGRGRSHRCPCVASSWSVYPGAARCARLGHATQHIGDVDLSNAATAGAHGLVLCTQSRRHFERVGERKIETI